MFSVELTARLATETKHRAVLMIDEPGIRATTRWKTCESRASDRIRVVPAGFSCAGGGTQDTR